MTIDELKELVRRYFEALRLYDACGFNDPSKELRKKLLLDIRDRLVIESSLKG